MTPGPSPPLRLSKIANVAKAGLASYQPKAALEQGLLFLGSQAKQGILPIMFLPWSSRSGLELLHGRSRFDEVRNKQL